LITTNIIILSYDKRYIKSIGALDFGLSLERAYLCWHDFS